MAAQVAEEFKTVPYATPLMEERKTNGKKKRYKIFVFYALYVIRQMQQQLIFSYICPHKQAEVGRNNNNNNEELLIGAVPMVTMA